MLMEVLCRMMLTNIIDMNNMILLSNLHIQPVTETLILWELLLLVNLIRCVLATILTFFYLL